MNVASPKQGVAYTYYEGQCKRVADITSCLKVKEGIMKNFLIKDAAIADHFAYEFRTLIYISKRGVYRFYTISDDGSKLYIDDKLIVDNDGGHSVRRAEGKVALEKGYHALHLLYFENYMGQELEVGFLGRDIPETPIPAEMLFCRIRIFFSVPGGAVHRTILVWSICLRIGILLFHAIKQ